ncbi:MAG: VanZ family protein [Cyanobacteria bacterium P01_A01_bin.84]
MNSHRSWVIAFWFYIGIIITIVVSAYLRFIPNEIQQFPHYDTILHFLLIGFSAFLGHLALRKRWIKILFIPLPLAPILIGFFVTIEEFLQILSPHRSFDVVDLAANFAGLIIFTLLAEMKKLKVSS